MVNVINEHVDCINNLIVHKLSAACCIIFFHSYVKYVDIQCRRTSGSVEGQCAEPAAGLRCLPQRVCLLEKQSNSV